MKARIISGLIVTLAWAASSSFAQEFTLTTTAANTVSSKSTLERPELTGNPLAIIVATPVGGTEKLNPHPIGAWYYNDKWNIFNTDHAAMPLGAQYKIQVFLKPGPNQFLHIVTRQNLGDQGSYLDNPALNNNPKAQIKILQNFAPDNRSGYSLNLVEAKAIYNSASGKWHIANVNGEPLFQNVNTAYSVVITPAPPDGSKANAVGAVTKTSPIPTVTNPATVTDGLKLPQRVFNVTPRFPEMRELLADDLHSASTVVNNPRAPSKAMPTGPTTTNSMQLAFDNLNDFAVRGLPPSAAIPAGNPDQAASVMARQIARSDENSLPVLLAALQMAGFTIIDENGKVLLRPADGKGQGLGFYDFEAVGSLKLAKSGVIVSLEKIAGTITKGTPDITASQFAESILKDLRTQANNSDNPYLRFYSRLIIELGKASAQPVDLMTVPAGGVKLSILQATLLTRRLQGDIYTLKARLKPTGMSPPRFPQQNIFISASWTRDDFSLSIPVSRFAIKNSPCNLNGDEALIMDGSAIVLTTGNGAFVGLLGPTENAAGKMTKLGKLSTGLAIANIVLAWGKLVAALTTLKGEIIVAEPLPLVRTKNSVPGDKRLMTARVWSEVGKPELLNCLRPAINIATGLDFNLPSDGPVGDTFIEWAFEGENTTNLDSKKFVFFETMPGTDPKPNKQLTDDKGISKMHLVGYPKKPVVVGKAIKVQKKADVLVAVTLKSSKDFVQNWLDLGGTIIGVATGGPLGLIGAAAEIGYRAPYVVARATVPVTDHEPCDKSDTESEAYWYLDYTVTVKGKSSSVAEGGSATTKWSIDRTYSGKIPLNNRHVSDSPEHAATRQKLNAEMATASGGGSGKNMDLAKMMAVSKKLAKLEEEKEMAQRNVEYSSSLRDAKLHVRIDDRLEQYSEEVCEDDSEETKTNITIWKADETYQGGGDRLVLDNKLQNYNVWIPGHSSGAKMSMFTMTRYERTQGVAPSKQDTVGEGKKLDIFALPDVQGLINGGVIEHLSVRPFPTEFPTEFEFDSGDLTPDRPLIASEADSQTDVKVRVIYRFTKGCK